MIRPISPFRGSCVAAFLIVSSQAGRAGADVAVRDVGARAQIRQLSYEVNPQLGRAWVSFFMIDDPEAIGDAPGYRAVPTITPGLRYDQATREILFEEPGHEPVVCARVVPKRFLFIAYDKIEETGGCGITRVVDAAVKRDDGFWVTTSTRRQVYFGRTR